MILLTLHQPVDPNLCVTSHVFFRKVTRSHRREHVGDAQQQQQGQQQQQEQQHE